jgi:hypothetical protein
MNFRVYSSLVRRRGLAAVALSLVSHPLQSQQLQPDGGMSPPVVVETTALRAGTIATSFTQARERTQDWDVPGSLATEFAMPGNRLSGPGWRLTETAACDSYLFTYELWTSAGWFFPHSSSMLRIRKAEAEAVAKLNEMQQTPLFLKGISSSATGLVKSTGQAFKHPIDTLKKVPVGLGRFAGGMVARAQEGYTPGESGTIIHLPAKRSLAFKLGVDPYSDNEELQQGLNAVAANSNYGALTFGIGTAFIGGIVGTGVTVAKWNDRALNKLRDKSGAELTKDNRRTLRGIGAREATVDDFIERKGLSVTRVTIMAEGLYEMKEVAGINQYLNFVMFAQRPEIALYHQQQVTMAANYHENQGRLTRFQTAEGMALFYEGQKKVHLFAPVDTILWTPETKDKTDRLQAAVGKDVSIHVWILGQASAKALSEYANRGIIIHEDVKTGTPTKK